MRLPRVGKMAGEDNVCAGNVKSTLDSNVSKRANKLLAWL